MPTKLKVRKIGTSMGLLLPRDIVADLNVEAGTMLFFTKAPDGRFYLTQFDPEFSEQIEAARAGMRQYRNALKALAE